MKIQYVCREEKEVVKLLEFVNLMEARSLGIIEDEQQMEEFWYSSQWVLEPVLQGIRYQCLIDDNNELKFLGKRKDYKQDNSAHFLTGLIEEIKSLNLPKNSLLEGCLTFGNNQQKAYQFLKSQTEIEEDYEFYFSDIMYLDNKELFLMPLFTRLSKLASLITEKKIVKLQKGYTANKKQVYSELKDSVKVFLFKDLESVYTFRQSMSWRILKIPVSFFMTIMGFVENKEDEKFRSMVMALEGGQLKDSVMTKIMNIPVHSNEDRLFLYKSKQDLLGKVFEFLASERTKKGKFQETRFLKIRDDKKPDDCIWEGI